MEMIKPGFCLFFLLSILSCANRREMIDYDINTKVDSILSIMTLDEKIGQLQQLHYEEENKKELYDKTIKGRTGSIFNLTDPVEVNKVQKFACEKSRLSIPLLFARDVVHGFKTIFPTNIGLAATFNPELVKKGSRIAAIEATSHGLNWTFAPMIDISRDPRWGRIAESFGEDPYLASVMGLATVEGFQGDNISSKTSLAATAKHFAGYGAVEGGRDYNTVNISRDVLQNIYLSPFRYMAENNCRSFMVAFNDLDGIPCTGSEFLVKKTLREQWGFDGVVVSDWSSITEMMTHGYAIDESDAAMKAINAGVDVEMESTAYADNLNTLVEAGKIDEDQINDAVRRILRLKFELGLFDDPYVDTNKVITNPPQKHFDIAYDAALESIVMLKNDGVLPIKSEQKIAVIGPMADDRYEQLGTWTFDGDTNLTITPLMELRKRNLSNKISYVKAMKHTRDLSESGFREAKKVADKSDVIVFFLGEEAILTGEAHSRATLELPGVQEKLIKYLAKTGKPVVLVVMTSRSIILTNILDDVDAILYAWHPGTMGGRAIADVLTGSTSPSGRLPVTFLRTTGQVPTYYNHKNTGRPTTEPFIPMEQIEWRAPQTSTGCTSKYEDVDFHPLFPFGFGLSYTTFEYGDFRVLSESFTETREIMCSVTIKNNGKVKSKEVVQLYIRDIAASLVQPVKELKKFEKVSLDPGQRKTINFTLTSEDLSFYDLDGNKVFEPGEFELMIGPNSQEYASKTIFVSN